MKTWKQLMHEPIDEKERLIVMLVIALSNERAKRMTVGECAGISERIYTEHVAMSASSAIETGVALWW